MSKAFVRPPHPFDLTPLHLTDLWNRQETTESNQHPDQPLNLPKPWHGPYLHGEIRSLTMLLTGASGPLTPPELASFRYLEAEALIAIYIARAWSLARNPTTKGMLAGKPAYEAWDMLCARVRSSVSSTDGWSGWWPGLRKRLGIKAEQVPQEYALCWESILPTLPPMRKLRDPDWSRVYAAAAMVAREPGWHWQYLTLVLATKGDAVPSYLETLTDAE